jgi:glycerol uptake facilitator-like aquaporin
MAEALGTAILVATVIGSGIMAESLAGGIQAMALLGNTIPTGAILVVIITILGPVSGAHFNPAVTLVFASRGEMPWNEVLPYIIAQCAGAVAGTVVAHFMFDLAPLAIGTRQRSGPSQWLAEAVATFTLVQAILGGLRYAPSAIAWVVGLTITAAYWFTASTAFANPAVTLTRGFTTTFAGIAINHVPGFVLAQLAGAALICFSLEQRPLLSRWYRSKLVVMRELMSTWSETCPRDVARHAAQRPARPRDDGSQLCIFGMAQSCRGQRGAFHGSPPIWRSDHSRRAQLTLGVSRGDVAGIADPRDSFAAAKERGRG